jgi:multiple sugar transport system permease protein
MVTPFVWMILTSLKPATELVEFAFLPKNPTLANYAEVLSTNNFGRWYFNSILIAVISTASVAFFDTLVGYTLNKFDFPGKHIIFIGILATLMVPTEMLIIPWFNMSVQAGWNQGPAQYWGIVFPGVITAVGIFLMRQFFDGVPNELLDAARIDGMNEFGIFWRIAVPLVKPAIAALCIFNFIGNWNAYLWPLIIASTREFYTLPVGLSFFRGETSTQWEMIMTGASLATVPLVADLPHLPAPDHQGDRADRPEGVIDELSTPNLQPACPAAGLSLTRRRCLFEPMLAAHEAHAVMLAECGIITPRMPRPSSRRWRRSGRMASSPTPISRRIEDLFFRIEARIIALAGADDGGNLQLARSRNDLGHALARMALRTHAAGSCRPAAGRCAARCWGRRFRHLDTLMPGYTHTQPAQPSPLRTIWRACSPTWRTTRRGSPPPMPTSTSRRWARLR